MVEVSEKEVRLVEHLELQIIVLEREWLNYEGEFFYDWNKVFSSMKADEIRDKILNSLKEEQYEKKEFKKVWHATITLFRRSADYISNGKKKQIEKLYYGVEKLKKKMVHIYEW